MNPSNPCNHMIHEILNFFPDICNISCYESIAYRHRPTDPRSHCVVCQHCYHRYKNTENFDELNCHWFIIGEMTPEPCTHCNRICARKRPILQCRECLFTYLGYVMHEDRLGRTINNNDATAFCINHRQIIQYKQGPIPDSLPNPVPETKNKKRKK